MSAQPDNNVTTLADTQASSAPALSDRDQRLFMAVQDAPDAVKAVIASSLGVGWEDHQAQGVSQNKKRRNEAGSEEEPTPKRARSSVVHPDAGAIDFHAIRNLSAIPCLIKVNKRGLAGSLNTTNGGYGILLFLNGGKNGSPNIGLSFRKPGSDGHEVGRVNWYMDSRDANRWVIQDFEYVLVNEAPDVWDVSHPSAMEKCESSESLSRLMCLTLKLSSHVSGSCQRPSAETTQALRQCLNSIFWNKKDYTLRIWFIVPRHNTADVDTGCLAVIRYALDHRGQPLSNVRDRNGRQFAHLAETAMMATPTVVPRKRGRAHLSPTTSERQGGVVKAEPRDASVHDTPFFDLHTHGDGKRARQEALPAPSVPFSPPMKRTLFEEYPTKDPWVGATAGISPFSTTPIDASADRSVRDPPPAAPTKYTDVDEGSSRDPRIRARAGLSPISGASLDARIDRPAINLPPAPPPPSIDIANMFAFISAREGSNEEDGEILEEEQPAVANSTSIADTGDSKCTRSNEASLARQANSQLVGSIDDGPVMKGEGKSEEA